MPDASPIQYAFNGGKLGPRVQGRSDLARYATGCNTLTNFIPTIQGPAVKRSGFRHLKEVADSTKKTRLIPFEFSREQAYVLELGEGYMRVMKDSGAVLESSVSVTGITAANPVVVTATNTYSNGDEVYLTGTAQAEVNGRFFTVGGATGTNFTLVGEDGTGRSTGSGGTAARTYEITDGVSSNSLPWLEAELFGISYVQTADVLYLAHGNHPPHKISRTSDTAWTAEAIVFDWPPFREENIDDDVLMTVEENTGSSKKVRLRGRVDDQLTITGTSNASPVVVTLADTGDLANGDTVYIDGVATATSLNENHYVVANLVANTSFELSGTSAPGAAGTGGTAEKLLSVDTPFTSDMATSGEEAYIKLREVPLSYVRDWVAQSNIVNIDGRWTANPPAGTLIAEDGRVYEWLNGAGVAAVTGKQAPVHDKVKDGYLSDIAADTNSRWRFYNRFSGYAKLAAVSSDLYTATVDIDVNMPYSMSESHPGETINPAGFFLHSASRWSMGAWNAEYGYPRAVAFYEDRLWFASTDKDPQTFWGSRTGRYEDFEVIADEDDSSLVFTLASNTINAIQWMSGEDVLLMGTLGGEFTVDAGSADKAITPSNIRVRRRSNYGSAENVQPAFIDSALLFVHRSKERLYELLYQFQTDRYVAPDLTQMSYDILSGGVVEMAYQAAPFRLLWCALTDGSLASLTYVRDEDVIGWAQHSVGGTSAKVESVAAIPHPDGDEDQLWAVISRTINGGTKRYIEYLEKPFADDGALADAFFVDSGLTYNGAATTSIVGLDHLEGETVKVVGDGTVQSDQTVTSGAITITSASKVHVGLAMPEAQLQTMRLEAGQPDGTAMGRTKRIHQSVFRVHNTAGTLKYGADFTNQDDWSSTTLYTGDTESLAMPGDWEQAGRVALAHDEPLPCTIVGVMPQLATESI